MSALRTIRTHPSFAENGWTIGIALVLGLLTPFYWLLETMAWELSVVWLIFCACCGLLMLYACVRIVDPVSTPALFGAAGAFLKLLSVFHAIFAIWAGYHLYRRYEEASEGARAPIEGVCAIAAVWLMALLTYFAGDGALRRARIAGQLRLREDASPLPSPMEAQGERNARA